VPVRPELNIRPVAEVWYGTDERTGILASKSGCVCQDRVDDITRLSQVR
jgi:hypothetical protein